MSLAPIAAAPATTIGAARRTSAVAGYVRAVRADLIKLTRRRSVVGVGLATAVLAVGGTVVGMRSLEPAATAGGTPLEQPITIEAMTEAGGGTLLFAQTVGFLTAFLLAAFIASVAAEFSRGTFRTMLLRQPRRFVVLGGKLTAMFVVSAVALTAGAAITWAVARLLASGEGVDPSAWWSVDGLAAALGDVGRSWIFLAVTIVLGTALGVVTRSVPVGIGAALIWFGPIENVLGEDLDLAPRWFPGLLMRAVTNEGSTGVSTGRALVTLAAYSLVAVIVTIVVVRRRDVTA
ncbi:MAG: ABC transporter permease [Desertimonas sp.]